MMDETRARFLAAIAAQLPVERIAEVHLFPVIKQGGMESGVAVLAVEFAREAEPEAPLDGINSFKGSVSLNIDTDPLLSPINDTDPLITPHGGAPFNDTDPLMPVAARRYTVFSARYRHTLKGPDRGKWEVSVTEEADAPLFTIDAVVRGVQRRSGDLDDIVRLSGDEMRAALPVPAVQRA